MQCRNCGGTMQPKSADIDTTWRGHNVTFKDMPVYRCPNCGHMVMEPDAADLMSDLVDAKLASHQPVPEVLTVEEAAAFLKLSTQTVYNLQKAGVLPGTKVGNQIRYLRSALQEVLAGDSLPQAASFRGQPTKSDLEKIARRRRKTSVDEPKV